QQRQKQQRQNCERPAQGAEQKKSQKQKQRLHLQLTIQSRRKTSIMTRTRAFRRLPKIAREFNSFTNGGLALCGRSEGFLERFLYSGEEGFGYLLIAFLRKVHQVDELFMVTIQFGLGVNQVDLWIFF